MAFWTRVRIEQSTVFQTDTGNPRLVWETELDDVEARLLPLDSTDREESWATPGEDAYEVHLRHGHLGIRPRMRVVATDGRAYDIRRVIEPPPFGDPTTVLQAVRTTP